MKISKKSWHYRYLKWWGEKFDQPMTLCRYCELLFLTIVFLPIFFAIASPFIGVGYLVLILLPDWLEKRSKEKPLEELGPDGRPIPRTLAGKWLRAKKDRVCPILEWTE